MSRTEASVRRGWRLPSAVLLTTLLITLAAGRSHAVPAAATDHAVVNALYDQYAPALAAGDGGYFAAWTSAPATGDITTVQGRTLNADGSAAGAIILVAGGSKPRRNPAVVWNATANEYLVAYELVYSATDSDIYVQRVAADGALIGGGHVVIDFTTDERAPAVAWNAGDNNYVVVWQQFSGGEFGNWDVYGRVMTATGSVSGDSFSIANNVYDELSPAIAHAGDNNSYLVAFSDRNTPPEYDLDIYAQRLGASGARLGGRMAIVTWEYEQLVPQLAYSADADQFLIVWEDHHWGWGSNWDIFGQRVASSGSLTGGNFGISWVDAAAQDDRYAPAVAYNSGLHNYLVGWGYALSVDDHYAGRRAVGSDAALGSEYTTSAHSADVTAVAVAASSAGSGVVLWQDGRNVASGLDLYDTSTAAAPTIDLTVARLEVTQAIQCLDNPTCADNSVPLIAGKPTYVRIYVGVSGTGVAVPNVAAEAYVDVGGYDVYGVALNPSISAPLSPQRAQYAHTLNFAFPDYLLDQSGTLHVKVNPLGLVAETNAANNSRMLALNFVTTDPLNIVPVRVRYNNQIVAVNMAFHLESYLENILPVGDVVYYLPGTTLDWTQPIGPDQASWGKVLAALNDMRKKNTSAPADAHWYGMLPFAEPAGNIAGLSPGTGGQVVMGRVELSHVNLEDGADIMAHELGHNFGRPHSPCGVTPFDPAYPFADGGTHDVGWDPQGAGGGKVQALPQGWLVPATAADIMSYCQDEWISAWTYRHILDYRGSTPARAPLDPRVMQPFLFASGTVQGDTVEFDPFVVLERPDGSGDENDESSTSLRLYDAEHNLLESLFMSLPIPLPTDLSGSSTTEDAPALFYVVMPWHPETATIELWDGTQRLATRSVSANPPAVTLEEPFGGATWSADGEYTVRWTADDADGDNLYADIGYSADNGETWQMLATRLPMRGRSTGEYIVNAGDLAGSGAARVSVTVSDGVLTDAAGSGVIAVADHVPLVTISAPRDGAAIGDGSQVVLHGAAFDAEDGTLSGSDLIWTSNRDGWLGTGEQALVALSVGTHAITLSTSDSAGHAVNTAVTLYVGVVPLAVGSNAPAAQTAARLWLLPTAVCLLLLSAWASAAVIRRQRVRSAS